MLSKLVMAISITAVVTTASSMDAPAPQRTPSAQSVAGLLAQAGEPARVVDLSCERRPSQLFGPQVFRCRVQAERQTPSPTAVQMTLTLAAHDGGWVIVAR
jgi:hypothetical protein